jgi:hypothetical protein
MVKENDAAADRRSADDATLHRKPYKPPQLTKYGSVARLTAGVNGSFHDPGHSTPTRNG